MTDRIPQDLADGAIDAALESASLPALLPAIIHLTGDVNLLTRFGERLPGPRGDDGAGIAADNARNIRALAARALRSLRDGEIFTAMPLPDRQIMEMIEWSVGEKVPADYLQLLLEEAYFDERDLRKFQWSPTQRSAPSSPAAALKNFRVVIIGAGLGGLCAAIRLAQAGVQFTILEKDPSVGGTWFENNYPGCRVDVANHFYSYSFEPNPDWGNFYARRDELQAYIERCVEKYDVRRNIRFNCEVTGADFVAQDSCWRVRVKEAGTAKGESELRCNALISAVGMLNRPVRPDIPGIDSFKGLCRHSAEWRAVDDLRGLRVAIIGSGASATQLAPAIAAEVERLSIFQRTPHWLLPNPNYHRPISDGKRWLLRHMPYYAGWYRIGLFWSMSDRNYPAFRIDPAWERQDSIGAANDALRRVMTRHIQEQVGANPALYEKVLPDYPPLGKRILQDHVPDGGWYRTLTRENVELVTEPIERITADAIVTNDDVGHPVDAIVLATGFHANRFLWPIEIAGRSGTKLQDVWGEDPRAYLGITIPDFPNLFCLYGPNTNPVVGSVIFMLECQVRYIMSCIGAMVEQGIDSMECRRDVHDAYNAAVDAENEMMVWRHPRVHSYYNNSKGRVTTNAPWRLIDYWKMTRSPDFSNFILR